MEIVTHNLQETKSWAGEFLDKITKNPNQATVVLLYGDLGAGKTSFTQGLAEALGIGENIISPTFVIEKIYQLPAGQKFDRLIHIDCYRLEKSTEITKLGFAEIIADKNNLIIIEWPEKIADILPETTEKLTFIFNDENTRTIKYGH